MSWLYRDLKTIFRISIFWTTQKMTKVTKVAKSDPLSTILSRFLVILFLLMILQALTSIWWNSKVDQAWNNMSKTIQSNGVTSFGIDVLVKQNTCTWAKKKAQKKTWDQVLLWKWLNPFKTVTVSFFFFYNFFNIPSLIAKLYERGLYGIGNAQKDMKGMPEMPFKRKMKRGDFEYLYFDKVACCKWLEMHSVTMLFRNCWRNGKNVYSSPTAKTIIVKNPSIMPRRFQIAQQGKRWDWLNWSEGWSLSFRSKINY